MDENKFLGWIQEQIKQNEIFEKMCEDSLEAYEYKGAKEVLSLIMKLIQDGKFR